jgi:mRNA interferase MazF
MAKAPTPKRGEVWLVDFDPSVGAEIRKIRPAVVTSMDTVGRLPLRLVVPITDWKPLYASFPWFVELPATIDNGLAKDSGADCFQTKSLSENRFVQRLGEISTNQLDDIASAIALCVGAP